MVGAAFELSSSSGVLAGQAVGSGSQMEAGRLLPSSSIVSWRRRHGPRQGARATPFASYGEVVAPTPSGVPRAGPREGAVPAPPSSADAAAAAFPSSSANGSTNGSANGSTRNGAGISFTGAASAPVANGAAKAQSSSRAALSLAGGPAGDMGRAGARLQAEDTAVRSGPIRQDSGGAAAPSAGNTSASRAPPLQAGRGAAPRPRSSAKYIRGKVPDVPTPVFEYFKLCEAFLSGTDGGPPRFLCPLDAKPNADPGEVLPRLMFLPGIEGTGFGLCLHHKTLAQMFDLICLSVPIQDRTSFEGLVDVVEQQLLADHSQDPGRAIFILGESFGAVLALAASARHPSLPITLILVNPATAFERSQLQPLFPLIPLLPDAAYQVLPILLSFQLGNPIKMASSGIRIGANPIERALAIRDNLLNMIPTVPEISKLLPKETVEWKLQLLGEGAKHVEPLLPKIAFPTLILASGEDNLVPSAEEATRLKKVMASAKVSVRKFSESGHTLLLEGDLDVANVIKGAGIYRRTSSPRENPAVDSFPSPTVEDLARVKAGTDGLVRLLSSPVFFSTLEDGTIVQGFEGLPPGDRPLLFVGNHQTYAPDMSILVGETLDKTGILMRGLAHPMAMGQFQGENADSGSSLSDTFRTFGAVPVTPTVTFKLLSKGEALLLFPGGAREALKKRGEEYKLFWPEREEFIRMAIKFKATIIPFAAVGVDDGFDVVLDGDEILKLPYLGQRAKEFMEQVPRVRDESAGPAVEQFVGPIVRPKQLNRLYFLFQKPIPTEDLSFALKNKEITNEMYRHVKQEVEDGISYLLRKREEDPYKDPATRIIYEASWGGTRQAPTFAP